MYVQFVQKCFIFHSLLEQIEAWISDASERAKNAAKTSMNAKQTITAKKAVEGEEKTHHKDESNML